jgi:hypothetical protein
MGMGKRPFKRLLQTVGIFLVLLSCAVLVGPLLRLLRRQSPDPLTRLLELADERLGSTTGSRRHRSIKRLKNSAYNEMI